MRGFGKFWLRGLPRDRVHRRETMMHWLQRFDELALGSLPELFLFPSNQAKAAAIKSIRARRFVGDRGWVQLFFTAAALPVLLLLLRSPVFGSAPLLVNLILVLPASVVIGLGARFGGMYFTRADAAESLRDSLLKSGVPVCLNCGYCVMGVESLNCPECGRELDGRVREILKAERSHPPIATAPDTRSEPENPPRF